MDLTPSDEHRMLRESAERFARENFTPEQRAKTASEPHGFSRTMWKTFADLGWLGLPIAEEYDGFGGGTLDVCILLESLSSGIITEPYLSTVVLGAGLIDEAGSAEQKKEMLPKVVNGSLLLAFAHSEKAARFDLTRVDTTATRGTDGWILNGAKQLVIDGPAADIIIVSARIDDGSLRLFLLPRDQAGVISNEYPRLGGGMACNLTLDQVKLPAHALLGADKDALPAIETVIDRALAALGAEAVGIMQTVLERTLEYTKVRKQFGRPLGSNQVIRHRLVDMNIHTDESRSIAMRAALKADAEPNERGRAASGAKARIGKGARYVAEQSVQLHGAMGVTEELDIGAYFKRLLAFETLFGSSSHHYRRHASLSAAAHGERA